MESSGLPSNSSDSTDGTGKPTTTTATTNPEALAPPSSSSPANKTDDCISLPPSLRAAAASATAGTTSATAATGSDGASLDQPGMAAATEKDKVKRACAHQFVDNPQAGETVCTVCGQVGEQLLFSPSDPSSTMDILGTLDREFGIRNELYEVVSRLSGGDVSSIHVEKAMSLLQMLCSDESWLEPSARELVRRLGVRDGLDRGILAVVLHRAFEENGRKEDLELVGQQFGASKADVLHAEKILEMGRGYTQNSAVKVGIILNTQQLKDLPASWLRAICEALAMATEEAFCDIDSLVCAVGVCLARNIKSAITMVPRANKKYVDRGGMSKHLSLLTVKRMASLYGVSPGSVRRALDNLSGAVRECLWSKSQSLVMFFEPHDVQKRKLQAAFAAGKRKALKECACAPKKREFKEEGEEENWD